MAYYHCSPTAGLTSLEPRKPEAFEKPARVYLTTSLPMALMYGIRNPEYTYGYTKNGQIYFSEYFPGALEALYRGRSARLYVCAPASVEPTEIPNEAVSASAVPVVEEIPIPDVCEALLEQERQGALVIHRYHELTPQMLDWVRDVEADSIRRKNLLNTPGELADYYRLHYPESWAIVEAEEKNLLYHGSAVANLTELRPLSKLHDSDRRVVYLSSSIPYALMYIWDAKRMRCAEKWVTGWLRNGVAYYEEQFPGQLKAFYAGIRGHVYSALRQGDMQSVQKREDMFCCDAPVSVYRVTEIPDVYEALLRYEERGLFRVFRFEEAPADKQAELVDRIAACIAEDGLLGQNSEKARFMKRYFVRAWEKAEENAR